MKNIYCIGLEALIMQEFACIMGRKKDITVLNWSKNFVPSKDVNAAVQGGALLEQTPQALLAMAQACIFGRNVSADHPEYLLAQRLGIKLYSYADYLRDYAADKQRIVFVGDTEVVCISLRCVIHVLNYCGRLWDCFTTLPNVLAVNQLQDAASIMLFTSDFLPVTLMDDTPQGAFFNPHIVCMHEEALQNSYVAQRTILLKNLPKAGALFYAPSFSKDRDIRDVVGPDVKHVAYSLLPYTFRDNKYFLKSMQKKEILSLHTLNQLAGISAAYSVLKEELAVSSDTLDAALTTFVVETSNV